MSGSISIQNKKRVRVSWTEEHYIVIKEAGGSCRRCSHCTRTLSITTSTGTIAKQLNDKHGISSNSVLESPNPTSIQSALDTSNLLISRAQEKKVDCSVAKYFVREMLPNTHVQSSGSVDFLHELLPS